MVENRQESPALFSNFEDHLKARRRDYKSPQLETVPLVAFRNKMTLPWQQWTDFRSSFLVVLLCLRPTTGSWFWCQQISEVSEWVSLEMWLSIRLVPSEVSVARTKRENTVFPRISTHATIGTILRRRTYLLGHNVIQAPFSKKKPLLPSLHFPK